MRWMCFTPRKAAITISGMSIMLTATFLLFSMAHQVSPKSNTIKCDSILQMLMINRCSIHVLGFMICFKIPFIGITLQVVFLYLSIKLFIAAMEREDQNFVPWIYFGLFISAVYYVIALVRILYVAIDSNNTDCTLVPSTLNFLGVTIVYGVAVYFLYIVVVYWQIVKTENRLIEISDRINMEHGGNAVGNSGAAGLIMFEIDPPPSYAEVVDKSVRFSTDSTDPPPYSEAARVNE